MKIEHVAIWAKDLEMMKDFYAKNFNAVAGPRHSEESGFESYILGFVSGGRLEVMTRKDIRAQPLFDGIEKPGFSHLAISVGSRTSVDEITARLVSEGRKLVSAPRTTPDGYYESCILDPEGNRVEITAEGAST